MTREEWARRRGRSSKWISPKVRRRIYERDGWKCLWCGATTDLTLDHAVPRCRGGTNRPANLLTSCKSCNSARQNRFMRVFAAALEGDVQQRLNRVRSARRRKLPARARIQ